MTTYVTVQVTELIVMVFGGYGYAGLSLFVVCLSLSLFHFASLFVSLPLCLSLCLSVSVPLCLCLSVCVSVPLSLALVVRYVAVMQS